MAVNSDALDFDVMMLCFCFFVVRCFVFCFMICFAFHIVAFFSSFLRFIHKTTSNLLQNILQFSITKFDQNQNEIGTDDAAAAARVAAFAASSDTTKETMGKTGAAAKTETRAAASASISFPTSLCWGCQISM